MTSVNAFWQTQEQAGQWHWVERKCNGVERARTCKDVALRPCLPLLLPWHTWQTDHSSALLSLSPENAQHLQHYRPANTTDRIWHSDVESAKCLSIHLASYEWRDLNKSHTILYLLFLFCKRWIKHWLILSAFNWHAVYAMQPPDHLIFTRDTVKLAGKWENYRILYSSTISCLRFQTFLKCRFVWIFKQLHTDFLPTPPMSVS